MEPLEALARMLESILKFGADWGGLLAFLGVIVATFLFVPWREVERTCTERRVGNRTESTCESRLAPLIRFPLRLAEPADSYGFFLRWAWDQRR